MAITVEQKGDGANGAAVLLIVRVENCTLVRGNIGYKNHLNSVSKELDELWFPLLDVENVKSQIHKGNIDAYVLIVVK